MLEINGYDIKNIAYQGKRFVIYRATRNIDQKAVILKVCRFEQPTAQDLAALRHEYQILKQLKLETVVQAYDLIKYQQQLCLVLEDFNGQSLKDYFAGQPVTLDTFFKIAILLADSLGALHAKHILHKDINPSNILIEPESLTIKLADFGIASQLAQEHQGFIQLQNLEGTLAYISPEQTGRMNRAIDHRTDLYSLGVTFYELLTGKLPFENDDPLGLIHSHLAEIPSPISKIDPKIPAMIDAIIAKLLYKLPEERYTSAIGLKTDLLECKLQWQTKKEIAPFLLGRKDFSDKLIISQKLYGREAKIQELLAAFNQAHKGHKELLLISGYSGIGKSSLVQEINPLITRANGYFVSGKFDQLQRSMPYRAFIEALQELIKRLLSEPQEKLLELKSSLLLALGNNGQVIIDIIPNLALIIGPQAPLPDLEPAEAQNRFMLTFQNFIGVFAKASHPLVIFIDDLQWADSASLQLISTLMTDVELQHFLLIGAYRDNEVSLDHPFCLMLNEMQKANVNFKQVSLTPLTQQDVQNLLADSLNLAVEKLSRFAGLLCDKTLGNPFFISEFLKKLYNDKLLSFSYEQLQWQWNIYQIEQQVTTENVADLLMVRFNQLPTGSQKLLQLAACIGHFFDLASLLIISEQTAKQVFKQIWDVVKANLILPTGEQPQIIEMDETELAPEFIKKISYRFAHDRIQQAVYQSIEPSEKEKIHIKIGRILTNERSILEQDENLFEILFHFNQGRALITDATELQQIIQANYKAGKKAKSTTAYQVAKEHLQLGILLLTDLGWENEYDLCFKFHKELAECEYLTANFTAAENILSLLLKHAKTTLEKAEIYQLQIAMLNTLYKPLAALELGLHTLKTLGFKIPIKPKTHHILQAIIKIKFQTAFKKIENLNLNALDEPYLIMINKLVQQLSIIAFSLDQNLFTILTIKLLGLNLKYGYSPETPYTCLFYSVILLHGFNRYKEAFNFVQLSENIKRKLDKSVALNHREYVLLGGFITFWKESLKASLEDEKKGYLAALEAGDFIYANYCIISYCQMAYLIGKPLAEVLPAIESGLAFQARVKIREINEFAKTINFSVKYLLDHPDHTLPKVIDLIAVIEQCEHKTEAGCLYCLYIKLYYIQGLYEEAIILATRYQAYRKFGKGTIHDTLSVYYYGLALTANYSSATPKQKSVYLKKLRVIQRQSKQWSNWCPINFNEYDLLLSAEIAKVNDKQIEAMQFYVKAIQAAQDNESTHLIAIANECAGRFYESLKITLVAKTYLQHAYYSYSQWGALVKTKKLESIYPEWCQKSSTTGTTMATKTTIASSERWIGTINILSILKAAQVISSEIQLDKLLQKMLVILIQSAGAQRGILLLKENNNWFVKAEGTVTQQTITLSQAEYIERRTDIPKSLLNYVQRTQELLLIQNIEDQKKYYIEDIYLAAVKPQSILMLPILYQGAIQSLLYLENKDASAAFTPEHIQSLQLLTSQAAISLENAQLYYQATHDVLTGLANRNLLYQIFNHSFIKAQLNNKGIAILFLDLDGFKKINDTFGHEVGDKLLIYFAEQITNCLRENDLAARLGGDEFIVMLENLSDDQDIKLFADSLFLRLKKSVNILGHDILINSSMGISRYPKNSDNIQELLKQADIALYQVKENGKGYYQFYSNELNLEIQNRNTQESSLANAIENDEFCLFYQPVFNSLSKQLSHLEALLRWQHPTRGLLEASDFIPLAEKNGLIIPLSEWVLKSVCQQIKAWQSSGIKPVPIAVNISGLQFKKYSVFELVAQELQAAQIDPSYLELEFTESIFIEQTEQVIADLNAIKNLGVKLSIDDFGTYYSSFAYLKHFPVNKIKIDKCFIKDIPQGESDKALVIAIITMAHSLNLQVVAEGIETKQQLDFLEKNHVDQLQGYFLGKSKNLIETTKLLQSI